MDPLPIPSRTDGLSFGPGSGEVLAQIPRSTLSDVDRAVDAVSKVSSTWSQTPGTRDQPFYYELLLF